MTRRVLIAGAVVAGAVLVVSCYGAALTALALFRGDLCEIGVFEQTPFGEYRTVRSTVVPPAATCEYPVIHGPLVRRTVRWDVYLPVVPAVVLAGFVVAIKVRGPAGRSSRPRPTREPRRRHPAHRH